MKMKRVPVCFLLLAVFCLALCMPAKASNAMDEDLFTQTYFQQNGFAEQGISSLQMADWVGDTGYAYLGDMGVYTFQGEEKPTRLCSLSEAPETFYISYQNMSQEDITALGNTVTYIVAGGDGVYGYNVYSGKFGEIDRSGVHWQDTLLDMSGLCTEDSFFPNRVARSFLVGQTLYAFASQPAATDGEEYAFFGFDIKTGKATEYDCKGAVGICPQRDGGFFLLRYDEDGYRISLLDTATNMMTDLSLSLADFPADSVVGGMAYQAESDTLFVVAQGQVFRSVQGSAFDAVAYVPTDSLMPETAGWVLPDGRYAIELDGVHIRVPGDQPAKVNLVFQGGGLPQTLVDAYREQHPEVNLIQQIVANNEETVAQQVITQDSSVDVYVLQADYAYTAMRRKGMLADMSGSDTITKDVGAMDATIRDALTDGSGHIVAYPSDLYLANAYLNEGYWKLVFGDQPLPTTFEEILGAALKWETDDDAENYPDLDFLFDFDYAQWCEKLITLYTRQNDTAGEIPELNTPALRDAFQKLQQIDDIRKARGRSTEEVSDGEESEQVTPILFMPWREAMMGQGTGIATLDDYLYDVVKGDRTRIPLSFVKGDQVKTDGILSVYVINPYSKHIPEAIALIECATNVDANPYTYYATHPNVNTPYAWPDYEQKVALYSAKKEELEKAVQDAGDTNTKDLKSQLDYVNQWLETQEEQRWMISAETIRQYRSEMVNEPLDLHCDSLYLGSEGSSVQTLIQNACEQYASGTITLDAFLSELDQKMQMIADENE